MIRKLGSIIFLICCVWAAGAQSLADNMDYRGLMAQRAELKKLEADLSASLVAARKVFETSTGDEQKRASDDIVRLEGEVYDLRAKASKVSSAIAALEQEAAEQSLEQTEAAGQIEHRGFFNNAIFTKNLSRKDLSVLTSAAAVEKRVAPAYNEARTLYARLQSLKIAYDAAASQSQLDGLVGEATQIKQQLEQINTEVLRSWGVLYNYKLDTYLVLLDKVSGVDRSVLEALETQGREARRAEAFSEGLLDAAFVPFDAQRAYVQAYERAIAKGDGLHLAADSLARLKPLLGEVERMEDLAFDPRVLTIYAPVSFIKADYPLKTVAEVPEAIVPEKGIYYSVQIALMAAPPKTLDMFRGAWPLQVQYTSDGKVRYMVGGFDHYAAAQTAVSQLVKAGYKAPVMVAWVNGAFTSAAKAKATEATMPKTASVMGTFSLEVSTTDSAVGEKLRSVVEMHAGQDKSIARLAKGKELIYTVTQFTDRYAAEVLAQIIRERTGASVELVELK